MDGPPPIKAVFTQAGDGHLTFRGYRIQEEERRRDEGMEDAAHLRQALLAEAQDAARELGRVWDTITADDVHRALERKRPGYSPRMLGNAAGSIFRGGEWEPTGAYKKSTRRGNKARRVMVWRYRG